MEGTSETTSTPGPNIILIFADDLGIDGVGYRGGPFSTPRIDALAKEGMRFDNCYSTPLCGPSRCQVLTGRYPFRTGLNSNQSADAIQPGKEVMIPTVLKKAGYATACAGKWGQMSHGPLEWGFDESIIFNKGSDGRYWLDKKDGGYLLNGKKTAAPGRYFPDVTQEFVVDFIKRNKDRPFFVYYPMPHVHGPIEPTPDSRPGADKNRLYADNIEYMDKLVGQLMDELDRQDLRKRTLVLFTGDNGTARQGIAAGSKIDGRALSGQKGSMLEGGSRVPLIANWPGTTPAGTTNRDLVDFSDFFSTFAALADAPIPEGLVLDSHSFAAPLKGEKGGPREWVYVELNGNSYVADTRYKLTNKGELFDMSGAPFEEKLVEAGAADAAAVSARDTFQKVLDEHPADPGSKKVKKKKRKTT